MEEGTLVDHEKYGKGTVIAEYEHGCEVDFGKKGIFLISKNNVSKLKILDPSANAEANENETDMDQIEKTIMKILNNYSDISQVVDMGDKWDGGTVVLKPANPNQKVKEIPMDVFFHKIVMVRDRLRVMEQNINAHPKLNDADKVNLQQYITRIYGSLTTFNVLFKNTEDHFVGDKKSKDEE